MKPMVFLSLMDALIPGLLMPSETGIDRDAMGLLPFLLGRLTKVPVLPLTSWPLPSPSLMMKPGQNLRSL